jgi:hypothetical protein
MASAGNCRSQKRRYVLFGLVWEKLYTCNVERGHGIPELEVLVVQTVGVVGPGSIRGRMDPPRACIILFLFIIGLSCPCRVQTSLTQKFLKLTMYLDFLTTSFLYLVVTLAL